MTAVADSEARVGDSWVEAGQQINQTSTYSQLVAYSLYAKNFSEICGAADNRAKATGAASR